MSSAGQIDYECLTQNAMRGVIKEVLKLTAANGLPGDHHFYVSFDTTAEGVNLSSRLKEKYPHEMTVVLQHRFWDLAVHDDHFEVKLTFDSIPERLVVPFEAIKVFFDPSVRYGLQFEEVGFTTEAIDQSMVSLDELQDDEATIERFPSAEEPSASPAAEAGEAAEGNGSEQPSPAGNGSGKQTKTANGSEDHKPDVKQEPREAPESGAEIVSLDAFRKK